MSRASHRNTGKRRVNQVNENKQEFKAKEWDLSRCEDYMYRRKKSAKLNKVLDSLKNVRFSRRLSTLVTLFLSFSVKQWSHCFNQLLSFLFISLSFYLSVSSSFHQAFQAHFIERFKLISLDVSSLFLLDIKCFKLSSWHKAFQAHFIRRFKSISSC